MNGSGLAKDNKLLWFNRFWLLLINMTLISCGINPFKEGDDHIKSPVIFPVGGLTLQSHLEIDELHYEFSDDGEICASNLIFKTHRLLCYPVLSWSDGRKNPTLENSEINSNNELRFEAQVIPENISIPVPEGHSIIGMHLNEKRIVYLTFKNDQLMIHSISRKDKERVTVPLSIDLSIGTQAGGREAINMDEPFIFNIAYPQKGVLVGGRMVFQIYKGFYPTLLVLDSNLLLLREVELGYHTSEFLIAPYGRYPLEQIDADSHNSKVSILYRVDEELVKNSFLKIGSFSNLKAGHLIKFEVDLTTDDVQLHRSFEADEAFRGYDSQGAVTIGLTESDVHIWSEQKGCQIPFTDSALPLIWQNKLKKGSNKVWHHLELDSFVFVSIESGFQQAATGSILQGTSTLVLRVNMSDCSVEIGMNEMGDGRFRQQVTSLYSLGSEVFYVLTKNANKTHDNGIQMQVNIKTLPEQEVGG